MKLTLHGYSTALFSTWYFLEEYGLLFDAGDGLSAALLQKARKVQHVFISHADRDHFPGLLQLNQLNARPGHPVVYYPQDCGSFPHLEQFTKQFDPHVSGTVWRPLREGDEVQVRPDLIVRAVRNGHVPCAPHQTKSLSYELIRITRRLRPEYAQDTQEQIRARMQAQGQEALTQPVRSLLFVYSGDTPVEHPHRWQDAHTLIHEATFLDGSAQEHGPTRHHLHSRLPEVLEMVSHSRIQQLILGHFSSRYSAAEIDAAIREGAARYGLRMPVWRVLPGHTYADILAEKPVWQP